MSYASIATAIPALTLAKTQDGFLLLAPVNLPSGITITQFSSFTLTLRQDPYSPRQTTATVNQALVADPVGEGWPVVFMGGGVGSLVSEVPQVAFLIPGVTPLPVGPNAMAAVVYGTLMPEVIAGVTTVQLLPETWCSVLPS
jgi:hypothetical protein